jgi:hypothetical protein
VAPNVSEVGGEKSNGRYRVAKPLVHTHAVGTLEQDLEAVQQGLCPNLEYWESEHDASMRSVGAAGPLPAA